MKLTSASRTVLAAKVKNEGEEPAPPTTGAAAEALRVGITTGDSGWA